MKPRRTILIFDAEPEHSWLRLLLDTHGFKVESATSREELDSLLRTEPVDLVLVGPNAGGPVPLVPSHGGLDGGPIGETPVVLRKPACEGIPQMLERIRIALIRKRGPKKAVASVQWVEGRKAVGA